MRNWRKPILIIGVLALIASLALPLLARAGEAERKATIELMQAIMPQESYDLMLVKLTQAIRSSIGQGNENLPADFDKRMHDAIIDIMPYNEVLNMTADIYGKRFTVDEIKQIGAFYRTPVGRKLMKDLPDISAESMERTSKLLQTRLPQALKKHGLVPNDDAQGDGAPESPATPIKKP